MPPRAILLVSSRNSPSQRAHFSIFVPSVACSTIGTSIHVVGAPMMGYQLEFKRNHSLSSNAEPYETALLGYVDSHHIADSPGERSMFVDHAPRDDLETAASQIPAPRVSENFMAPVNDTTNRRCQEWTLEFVRHLVVRGLLEEKAVQIVQSKRDSPAHGIGLQPSERRLV
ncbi:uncharacterized protein BO96DRAFT_229283 [Aspergillus niger CBS 101883]|uniref:Uncharacterized protein n=3 Tax=Aspergillus niger TaxID=5061 RepID=A2QR99_ASPNC|nr:hypothetical protein An08g05278 [Aspergillus niger]XP_025456936.1 uncharacterized protein BO96DRAFT_229283 [Aspergillus niger CBS 101883]PYH58881.1 hypothetical protein BO96DRAFT_229283 [Aspergillus niger CBS 101883]RDH19111.1 hypothetical protein M747DRAFT_371405 [Aspergillus niger ATCC 13496]CAK45500.1 hypothetical protein An08g05278 [Aspergillus niger]|eukprot:XP_001392645.1 hypothetical protein ANI_1_1984074 [Aspergillus niger CBS 513.88]